MEKEGQSVGEWIGTGAEMLGLPQQVSAEEFRAIRRGLDPETGEPLRCRRVVDRVYQKPWGQETYHARELYDLTVSAPKGVSVQGILDPAMAEGHREAVLEIHRGIEAMCGATVVAKYEHSYSRKLDPQIHTHLVAANLAHDGEKWRTLHANDIYRSSPAITEDYRARLGEILRGWGYQWNDGDVEGISPELKQRFSQRSQERDESIEKHAESLGISRDRISNREVAVLVRQHRNNKEYPPAEELRERWTDRLTPSEKLSLIRAREEALNRSEKIRPSLNIPDVYESPLKRHHWDYGEEEKGPRMRL